MFIPAEIKKIIKKITEQGFEAFVVGGCVRDLLRGAEPEDWDITTNAAPEKLTALFPKSFCENKFGTVTVLTGSKSPKLKEVEITPFRIEAKYSDKRHPDMVEWAKTIEEDLARRDFTINAIAISYNLKLETYNLTKETKNKSSKLQAASYKIIDPYNGQEDLKNKIIRAVRQAKDRFSEDALRMLRAARFAATLGFDIEKETAKAIKENSALLSEISQERIRDEFLKIIMSDRASDGIELLRELGLLKYILPELEEGYNIGQNKHHVYDCYQHFLLSLKYASQKKFNQNVRIASLLHDVGKPRSKRGEGLNSTFYSHEIIGAKITRQILFRLKFSQKDSEKIIKLVRYHLFYYNAGEVTESSVRRLVKNAGIENMEELLQVRMADRIGSGVPKAEPYKLRHLKYIIEKVSRDPLSAKMLKINGNDIIKILDIKPGPKIGQILDILLAGALADPKKNKKEILEKEVKKLGELSEKELISLAEKNRKEVEEVEIKEDQMTKKKYWVS